MKWNLRHLRVFLAVVERGSVRQAAEVCHVSQPAVTQANAKLELLAGTPLFEHTSRGLFITEVGQAFAQRVRRAFAYLDPVLKDLAPRLLLTATATQLEMLIMVRETQNFTLAARRLGIAQPTVHRAVSQLEEEASRPLFERTSFGMIPTLQAQALAQAARLAFAELEQADADLGEASGREVAKIVIGASRSSSSYLVPRALVRFREKRPTLLVKVLDGPYNDLLGALRRGEIDFFIGAMRDPPPIGDIEQEPLFIDSLVLVARRNHPLFAKPRIRVADFAQYPWVVNYSGTPTRQELDKMLAPLGPGFPRSVVETESMILMRELLRESDHLGCVSRLQIGGEIDTGALAVLPYEMKQTVRSLGLTLRGSWIPTRAQSDFLSELRAVANETDGVRLVEAG